MSDDSTIPPDQRAAIDALKVVSSKPATRNLEQVEAHQIAMNEAKAAYRATMTPEDGARYDAIEQACKVLEAARVPFALFGRTLPESNGGFWQYHRFTYIEGDDTARLQDYSRSAWCCSDAVLRFFSHVMSQYSIAVLRPDGSPEELFKRGDHVYSRPPTPPTTPDSPSTP